MGLLRKLFSYLNEAWLEMKKVNWPSRAEVLKKTLIVVAFSAVVTVVLGGFDLLFNKAVLTLLSSKGQVQQFDIEDFAPSGESQPFEIEIGDIEEPADTEVPEEVLPEGEGNEGE